MPKLRNKPQKIRFVLVGGSATAIDFILLFVAKYLGVTNIPANIISTGISFCYSFVANKKYTFRTNGANLRREITLFVVITLFGLWVIQSIIIGTVDPLLGSVIDDSGIRLLVAKLLATTVTMVWNYLLYSRVVFTHKQPVKQPVNTHLSEPQSSQEKRLD